MTSTTTDRAGWITNPVRPGSPELASLLAEIAEGVAERELANQAPHESIATLKAAGLGLLRIPVAEGGGERIDHPAQVTFAVPPAEHVEPEDALVLVHHPEPLPPRHRRDTAHPCS